MWKERAVWRHMARNLFVVGGIMADKMDDDNCWMELQLSLRLQQLGNGELDVAVDHVGLNSGQHIGHSLEHMLHIVQDTLS